MTNLDMSRDICLDITVIYFNDWLSVHRISYRSISLFKSKITPLWHWFGFRKTEHRLPLVLASASELNNT